MAKPIIALVLLSGLAGCASPAEIAAQDNATCQSYGAQPGTPAYMQCRMIQDQRRDEHRREVGRAIGDSLTQAGQAMSRPQPVSPTINCTSQRVSGNQVQTTCD